MRLFRKLGCAVLAAVPVVALAACSSSDSNGVATGPKPEVSSIVVEAVPTADEAGLYIAQDNGYFKQQGLTVEIKSILGGELGMADLQTGTAQIVAGNYVSFILAQIARQYQSHTAKAPSPIDMRIIADGSQMQPGNQALYVMPNSRIKTIADLTKYHAKVALNTQKNVGQVLLGSLFKENGLNIKDYSPVYPSPTGGFPEMIQDLATGKVDAAWLPEPFGTLAQEQWGAVPLADFDQGSLENFPIGAYIGTKQWVQSHPNTVAAFLRALQQGQKVADSNRAAVETGLESTANLGKFASNPMLAATMTLDTYPLSMDVPVMQRVSDAMFEFGLEPTLKQPYQIINMIQPEPDMIR